MTEQTQIKNTLDRVISLYLAENRRWVPLNTTRGQSF